MNSNKLQQNLPIGKILLPENRSALIEKLGGMIIQFCNDIGILDMGDESVKSRCILIILKYYKTLTLDEIQEAFDMAIAHVLPLHYREYEHYGRMIPSYLSKILKAYTGVRQERKKDEMRKTIFLDPKEKPQYREDKFKESYRIFTSTGQLPEDCEVHLVYQYMEEQGLVDQLLTNQIKDWIIRRVDQEITEENPVKKSESPVAAIMGKYMESQDTGRKKKAFFKKKYAIIEIFKLLK